MACDKTEKVKNIVKVPISVQVLIFGFAAVQEAIIVN